MYNKKKLIKPYGDTMIVIRLARGGKKSKPFYRVVVADQRCPRDGRFIERLGHYNPTFNKQGDQVIELNLARIDHWIKQGAQMTERAKLIIKRHRKASIQAA